MGNGKMFVRLAALTGVSLGLCWPIVSPPAGEQKPTPRRRGFGRATTGRPAHFPHRIWAACDFEGRTPDYAWFGQPETKNIPHYPGNATALTAGKGPYQNISALMTGINAGRGGAL